MTKIIRKTFKINKFKDKAKIISKISENYSFSQIMKEMIAKRGLRKQTI